MCHWFIDWLAYWLWGFVKLLHQISNQKWEPSSSSRVWWMETKTQPKFPKKLQWYCQVECALRIWKRSVEDHKIRYTSMLCDGDSKSFAAICEAKVYGEVEVTKEDCVNHIYKRMGTALRRLSVEAKAQGSSISGKGKLTNAKIMKIQNYYGRAIKEYSNDVDLLKKRIFAIFFHLSSTDQNPKHQHCSTGSNSWCFGKGHWQILLILVLIKIMKLCQLILASGWFQYFKDYLKRVYCKDAQDMGLRTQMRAFII